MTHRSTHLVLGLMILICGELVGSTKLAHAADIVGVSTANAMASIRGSGLPTFAFEHFYPGKDNALKEFGAARSDHAAIALSIGECYDEIGDPIHWSPTVRAMLLFELDEHLMHRLTYDPAVDSGADGRAAPALNPFHAAAISFSDRVSRNRLEFRRELEDSRWWSNLFQILILALGAAATILVSIRSVVEKNNNLAKIVGVLAIVFSAGGTAISSMNTFEGSQATALRDQRALSQLQQLHWRIASDVLKKPELCSAPETPPGKAMEVVDAWRTRLESILDSAVESISKPGDISSGATGGDPGNHEQGASTRRAEGPAAEPIMR